ncbi:hypothetical protein [Spiroplasma floricola]|uniref:MFS transporter n=1 Tax=Spiroplasma floricola 23-6 TaxID=1336749 RepID=A0A2K8SD17_9MOLU|nr:hypothetical protein [Spiroplasma floricola]AUB31359.1 hypothetical protein SFLOR_v1c03020 [Spiroplasma floricola 23-6]
MQDWDLKILFPLLFIACIISMVFLCMKEKLQKGAFLWLVQIILFWIAAGFMGNQIKNQISSLNSISFIIASVFTTSFFLIILKPLATFSTGILKNRKIWIQISSLIMIILLFFICLFNLPVWALIIVSLLFSFCLASSTLFYLFLNEQSFYRIYILPSIWITFIFITFSTTFGIYLSNLNIVIGNSSNSSNISLLVILILMICSGFALSFLSKENKNMVQTFDQEILEDIPKKNNALFLIIYLLAFLLTITSAINNSLFIKLYIALNLKNLNFNNEGIRMWLRINDFAYLIPTIIASVISYKLLRKFFEQKYLVFLNMFVLFAIYTAMAFVQNPFIFIVLNIIAGICFNQIIYSLFSACLFWNYRAKRNPVTGFYGSAMFASYFIVDSVQSTLADLKVGVFKNFSNLDELLNSKFDFQTSLKEFDDISTIIMSISCVMILIAILIFYFMNNKIFADYSNYKIATQNLKILIKKRVITKTKTKLDIKSIEKGIIESNE